MNLLANLILCLELIHTARPHLFMYLYFVPFCCYLFKWLYCKRKFCSHDYLGDLWEQGEPMGDSWKSLPRSSWFSLFLLKSRYPSSQPLTLPEQCLGLWSICSGNMCFPLPKTSLWMVPLWASYSTKHMSDPLSWQSFCNLASPLFLCFKIWGGIF